MEHKKNELLRLLVSDQTVARGGTPCRRCSTKIQASENQCVRETGSTGIEPPINDSQWRSRQRGSVAYCVADARLVKDLALLTVLATGGIVECIEQLLSLLNTYADIEFRLRIGIEMGLTSNKIISQRGNQNGGKHL